MPRRRIARSRPPARPKAGRPHPAARRGLTLERLESRALLAAVNFTGAQYGQNFDGLGSATAWSNDSTLPAWSLFTRSSNAVTSIRAGNGGDTAGSFYSFGTPAAADRALGGIGSGASYFESPATGAVAGWIAVAIRNGTGLPQAAFSVRYDGEQWRNGGNTAAHTMTMQYGYGATFSSVASWTTAGAAFGFTSPVATATAGALDGNAAANRVAGIGGTVVPDVPWGAGTTLWVRWVEVNDFGSDHGLAIDNFVFGVPGSVATTPGAPTITGITGSDSRLTITFTPPATDGGAAITAYEYSLDGGSTWSPSSPALPPGPLVISGLLNGQAYAVRLRGVNAAGPGTPSTAVEGRPLGIDFLRIVTYNVLASETPPRPGLGTLIQAISNESYAGHVDQVDLLALQEVQSQGVTSAAVAAMLDGIYGPGTYAHGSVDGSTSGGGTSGVVYNTRSLRLLEEKRIGSVSWSGAARQTIRYTFLPTNGAASSTFFVYVSHFKALDTVEDAARRDVQARTIRADADALPEGTCILYVGDFNLYRSTEPAYQTLLAAGPGQAFDPLDRPGDWHDGPGFTDLFTQSPLDVAPPGFTGGGLDDRFDFQLVSGELLDGTGLDYRAGSYRTFGNNGSVPRNGSINDPRNTALPGLPNRADVLNLLTTVSDHLPVVADFSYPTIGGSSGGSITGSAWDDADGDGVWDTPGEPALAGWTVYLDIDRDGLADTGEPSAVTAADGRYVFSGLSAGSYTVAIVAQAGWRQTYPAATADGAVAPTAFPSDPAYAPAVRRQSKRLVPNDVLFASQWHLRNTGQQGGIAGEDARLPAAWDMATGSGVVIAVVDDGLQASHPDLAANYRADLSWDFNDDDANPAPGAFDDHGTAVAGIAAARGDNGIGVSGTAPRASLAALRLTARATTDQQEADALSFRLQDIDIYANSWGPDDTGNLLEAPGPLTRAALANGVRTGRDGRGVIYVWAAGNGLVEGDDSNYDGYANSRFTIAATAVDDTGRRAPYAEPGANILVAAPASGTWADITTTDRTGSAGYNVSAGDSPGNLGDRDYTNDFSGTSASAPIVAGVAALMLEANPLLGWRDVQHVLARSARRNDPLDADWSRNGAGLWVNHKYGFGVVDAAAAVGLATSWTGVGPEVSTTSGSITVGRSIPDASPAGITSSFTLGADILVESVEVVLEARHAERGQLQVVLTSPAGTRSVLADRRSDSGDDYMGWTFSTVRNWGESAAGTWTLTVADLAGGTTGTLSSWALNVYGSGTSGPPAAHLVTLAADQAATGVDFGMRLSEIVLDVAAGEVVTDALVRGGVLPLVKRGPGTLILDKANSHSGGTVVEAGEVVVRNPASLGTGVLEVRAGARVTLDVGGAEGNGDTNVVSLAGILLDPAGRLDVGTGRIRVAAGGFDVAAIRQALITGRNAGTWDGTAGFTSAAAGAGTSRAIGYRVLPSTGELRLGFAVFGDANLDGQVSQADVNLVVSGGRFGQGASSGAAWVEGDFNYSGGVTQADINLLVGAARFGQGVSPSELSTPTVLSEAQADPGLFPRGRTQETPTVSRGDGQRILLEQACSAVCHARPQTSAAGMAAGAAAAQARSVPAAFAAWAALSDEPVRPTPRKRR